MPERAEEVRKAGHDLSTIKFWIERPILPRDLAWVWEAFCDLVSSRPIGMGGVGMIPFEAIDRWATRHGFHGDSFLTLKHHIRALDREDQLIQKEQREPKDG